MTDLGRSKDSGTNQMFVTALDGLKNCCHHDLRDLSVYTDLEMRGIALQKMV